MDFIEKFGWSWSLASILGSAISGRNSLSQNEGQTSRSFKFFDEIQKFIQKLKEKVELDHLKSWPQFWQFWTLDDCNVSCWADGTNPIMDFDLWALGLPSPMKNKKNFWLLYKKMPFFEILHVNHKNKYSSSDLISWLNSRHYSHPKFKIANIEVNFWKGACQLC